MSVGEGLKLPRDFEEPALEVDVLPRETEALALPNALHEGGDPAGAARVRLGGLQ